MCITNSMTCASVPIQLIRIVCVRARAVYDVIFVVVRLSHRKHAARVQPPLLETTGTSLDFNNIPMYCVVS